MSILLAACLVVAVHDGDTITAKCPQRVKPLVIRVAELDAPEYHAFKWGDQPGRTAARDEAAALCLDQQATLHLVKFDSRTKRWIAHVTCQGRDLTYQLVAQGLAWSYLPLKGSPIPAVQKQAQDQQIGLWTAGNVAIPPTLWRANAMRQPPGVNLP